MADDQRPSISIGTPETSERRVIREALGKETPEALALADALRSRENELSQWLQDPANRKQLAANPLQALSEVVPPDILKAAGAAERLPPEVVKGLAGLHVQPITSPQTTPAMELFQKVWAFVSASEPNLAAFRADIPGTVRSVDAAAPQAVVDQVVAAYNQAMGIFTIAPIDSSSFIGLVTQGIRTVRSAELP